MARRLILALSVSLLPALLIPGSALAAIAPVQATSPPAAVPGRVIVEWAPAADRTEKVTARREAEVSFEASLGDPTFQLVGLNLGQTTVGAINELEANPAVVVAEPDAYNVPMSIPNDPLFGQEWGLENTGAGIDGFSGATAGADIDALGAWSHTVGTPSTVVADIDTGYRFDSPDLGPVAWVNPGEIPGNEIDDDGNGFVDDVHGYDFVGSDAEAPSEDANPTDDNLISGGHGVHTAGTIGAAGDNGVGITGVAQNIRLMPLRVCANAPATDEARCPTSSIIAAINYAGANGARVANLSLGGTGKSTAMLNAFAENPETLYVVAAGNDTQNNDSVKHYPCDYEPGTTFIPGAAENIVCVAATDQADQLASFSDWGVENVDLGAPGTEILSTYPATDDLFHENFEGEDFTEKWTSTGVNGGFELTNEAPLASLGMSDSPGATPVANSSRSSTLTHRIPVPAEDGSCQLSGRDSVSLGGGSSTLIIFKNGLSALTFQFPGTSGSGMHPFITAPMSELNGAEVGIRFRYTAGESPTASSGVWLDDLALTCYAPLSTPPEYAFLQGTSMATPHVSGAAALLFSLDPNASVEEVSHILLSSVDPDSSLAGKTASGGRLDAGKALEALAARLKVPEPPSLTATDPPSPGNTDEPRIIGSAEPGSTVRLYGGPACGEDIIRLVSAAELAEGTQVTVPKNTTSEISATATGENGKVSDCSVSITYGEDSKAPNRPALDTRPSSPANDNQPLIRASAEAGSALTIYSDDACEGTVVREGTAAEFVDPGVSVSVADDSLNKFTARATDAAGNTSPCSEPISYVEDSTPPAKPSLTGTDPPSPADSPEPLILGVAEAESKVTVYKGSSCVGSVVADSNAQRLAFPGIPVSVPQGTTQSFSITATDAAGNTSSCSEPISYASAAPIGPGTVAVIDSPATSPPASAPACTVPRLAQLKLQVARARLSAAGCQLGKVTMPKSRKGRNRRPLVVRSSSPVSGASTSGPVSLVLGPKRKRRPR